MPAREDRYRAAEHPDATSPSRPYAATATYHTPPCQAEALHQRALSIREHALEPDHPDVEASRQHLAALYEAQGQYAKAESLYQHALTRARATDRPGEIADAAYNRAVALASLGRYDEAGELLGEAEAEARRAGRPAADVLLVEAKLARLLEMLLPKENRTYGRPPPRQAYSHSASLGSRNRRPVRSDSHAAYASAASGVTVHTGWLAACQG